MHYHHFAAGKINIAVGRQSKEENQKERCQSSKHSIPKSADITAKALAFFSRKIQNKLYVFSGF